MTDLFLKAGISGVRGVVGESLTPQIALGFAQAFGTLLGRGSVLVGRDTRPSGPMIEAAVTAGLIGAGCQPVTTGVVPTPSLLILAAASAARGGILITASHNTAPWNALKFIDSGGRFLSPGRIEHLLDVYHQRSFRLADESRLRDPVPRDRPAEPHFARVRAYLDTARIREGRFRVAVDPVNGVGALYARPFLEAELGCEVVSVHDAPDGRFGRDPEPRPDALGDLAEAVRAGGCAVGFGQDPDGDRLTLVDERGEALAEDLTLAIAVAEVLEFHRPGPVVANRSTSKVVDHTAARFRCPVHRCPIGEVHVAEAMATHQAVVGGEQNGGVMVADVHPCRDSFTAMGLVLERLARTGRTLSELRREFPAWAARKERIPVSPAEAPVLLRGLRHAYPEAAVDLSDGVYADFGDRWIHVRKSNTEPILRVTLEAPDPDGAEALWTGLQERLQGIPRPGR